MNRDKGTGEDDRVERGWPCSTGLTLLLNGYTQILQNKAEMWLPVMDMVAWRGQWLLSLRANVKLNTIVKGNHSEALEISPRKILRHIYSCKSARTSGKNSKLPDFLVWDPFHSCTCTPPLTQSASGTGVLWLQGCQCKPTLLPKTAAWSGRGWSGKSSELSRE